MKIPPKTQGSGETTGNNIPSWIKNNAGWWADGSIGDSDFVLGIQFLIKEGIVKVHQTTQTKQPSYQPQSLFD